MKKALSPVEILQILAILSVLCLVGRPQVVSAKEETVRPHAMSGVRALTTAWQLYAVDADTFDQSPKALQVEVMLQAHESLPTPASSGSAIVPRAARLFKFHDALNRLGRVADGLAEKGSIYLSYHPVFDSVAKLRGTHCANEVSKEFGLGKSIMCCENPLQGPGTQPWGCQACTNPADYLCGLSNRDPNSCRNADWPTTYCAESCPEPMLLAETPWVAVEPFLSAR
jgi:competence protein ComGC